MFPFKEFYKIVFGRERKREGKIERKAKRETEGEGSKVTIEGGMMEKNQANRYIKREREGGARGRKRKKKAREIDK